MDELKQIISLLEEAQKLAKHNDIGNITQPGIVKEIIIADLLGHKLNSVKKQHDAVSLDGSEKYEYLTRLKGNTFQIHRIMREHCERRKIERVTRNTCFFCATFDRDNPLQCIEILCVDSKWIETTVLQKCTPYFERNSNKETYHFGILQRDIKAALDSSEAEIVWTHNNTSS